MNYIHIKLILLTLLFTSLSAEQIQETKLSHTLTPAMKIFKKKMRKGCRSTAIKFSRSHTRHQWQIIQKNDLLRREAKVLCPHLDTSLLSNKDWNKIYSFVIENAKDNPIILEC